MASDERLNPASTATEQQIAQLEKRIDDLKAEYIQFFNRDIKLPPEKKREDLEIAVRKLIYGGGKTPRLDMIIQNLAQRFNLYNNMWLKKVSEMEYGSAPQQKTRKKAPPPPHPGHGKGPREVFVTLNDEETFERLVDAYRELLPDSGATEREREKIIEGMKAKMVTHNLVEARVTFTLQGSKLSIRIKK
jgi:hypothetical protein